MPSIKKYVSDTTTGLHFPGTFEGFPFRGQVPDLKGDELQQQVGLILDYQSKRFLLWDEQEHAEFKQVMDRIVNGRYLQHKRYDRWSDQHCGLVVWLEWVEIYGEHRGQGGNYGQAVASITG